MDRIRIYLIIRELIYEQNVKVDECDAHLSTASAIVHVLVSS